MKLNYPATHRNRDAILNVLQNYLPESGHVLEVASGSGQHVVYFAKHFPELMWQPSDIHEESIRSIDAWVKDEGLTNVAAAVTLDVLKQTWPDQVEVLYCANMIHIAPWECCEGLFKVAKNCLRPQGILALYGPFFQEGVETAPSNIDFDESLKCRNPSWGIRTLRDVIEVANTYGFKIIDTVPMPANNLTVIFKNKS